jgi:hypothetical protein
LDLDGVRRKGLSWRSGVEELFLRVKMGLVILLRRTMFRVTSSKEAHPSTSVVDAFLRFAIGDDFDSVDAKRAFRLISHSSEDALR